VVPLAVAILGLAALFALLGFIHHFLYRLDRPSIIGKPWLDSAGRFRGNIGQQIISDSKKLEKVGENSKK
jgi:hypothetical protein